jgi:hypothetical protein
VTGRLAKIPKDFQAAYDAALRQGWTVKRTGNSHLAWQPPGGGSVFTPGTPSDNYRGIQDALAKLKGAGLVLSDAPRGPGKDTRGSKPPARRQTRGGLLAEARAIVAGRPAAARPDTGLYDQLTALRAELNGLYSFERCREGCPHLGWAHPSHCTRECGCGMRLRQGAA